MKSLKNLIYESTSLQNTFVMELLQAEKPNMSLRDENEVEDVLNNMKKQEGKEYKKEEVDFYSKQKETKDDTMEVLRIEVCDKKEANEDTKPEADQLEVEYEDDFEDISEEISESIDEESTTTSSTTSSSPSEAADDETEPSIVQIQQETSLAQVQQEPSLAKDSSATVDNKSESSSEIKNTNVEVRQEPSLIEESTHATAEAYLPIVTPLTEINNFINQDNKMKKKNSTSKNPSLVADTQPKALLEQDLTSTVDDHVVEDPLATKSADPAIAKILQKYNQPKKTTAKIDDTPVINIIAPKSIIDIFGRDNKSMKTTTTKSNLKLTSSYEKGCSSTSINIIKKAVSFNDTVDGQIYQVDSSLMESNKEFLMALKPPQVSNNNGDDIQAAIEVPQKPQPYRKVYDAPVYHPIKLPPPPTARAPAKLPQLKNVNYQNVGKLPQMAKQEKMITAADIFGPSSKDNKIFDDVCANDGVEDLLADEDLDDAIDFLLNM